MMQDWYLNLLEKEPLWEIDIPRRLRFCWAMAWLPGWVARSYIGEVGSEHRMTAVLDRVGVFFVLYRVFHNISRQHRNSIWEFFVVNS